MNVKAVLLGGAALARVAHHWAPGARNN